MSGDKEDALGVTALATRLLFVNGQTTEQTIAGGERFAAALGLRAEILPRWGELQIRAESADPGMAATSIVAATPTGVDMRKVAAVMELADQLGARPGSIESTATALRAVERMRPTTVLRFATMAAIGAMALGVIFGARQPLGIGLIGASALVGGALRRWLATVSHNLFVQPFGAALLAGLVGAYAIRFDLSGAQRLVAVCPCMVLVPGPHLLNGAIDLVRGRVPLGAARLAYGALTVLAICTGLLTGLSVRAADLPIMAIPVPVPLATDVLAAGFAVAAYGTFFSMPWRSLPISGLHWDGGARCAMAPDFGGRRAPGGGRVLRLPAGGHGSGYAGRATSPSLRSARLRLGRVADSGRAAVQGGRRPSRDRKPGGRSPAGLLDDTVANGASAFLILLGMTLGLILPKMLIPSRRHPLSAG